MKGQESFLSPLKGTVHADPARRNDFNVRNHLLQTIARPHINHKHCRRHNGPRLLSLKFESLRLKRIQNPGSALLAFLHSLVTTFPTLCTSVSSYSSNITSMLNITSSLPPQCNNNRRQHDYAYTCTYIIHTLN